METVKVIAARRSVRRFSARPVERTQLQKLLEAARFAPCAMNRQTLRYVVVTETGLLHRLFDLTRWGGAVAPRRSPQWGKDAPSALIAVTAPDVEAPHIGADAGAAIENILLAATDAGLGCCWLGAFDRAAVDALLDLKTRSVLYLVAVGYPAESPRARTVSDTGKTAYFLDENDVLRVPKLAPEILVEWK
ncbi:MAG: nitroreductase family protein [Victivallaceae bacterium]|nr:nitroreductase family protein [Victivallaceae bacterium]